MRRGLRIEYLAALIACAVVLVGALAPAQKNELDPWMGDFAPKFSVGSYEGATMPLFNSGKDSAIIFTSDPNDFRVVANRVAAFQREFPEFEWTVVLSKTALPNSANFRSELPQNVRLLLDADNRVTNRYLAAPAKFFVVSATGIVIGKAVARGNDFDYGVISNVLETARDQISR